MFNKYSFNYLFIKLKTQMILSTKIKVKFYFLHLSSTIRKKIIYFPLPYLPLNKTEHYDRLVKTDLTTTKLSEYFFS